jgi:hypothetical protein
MAKVTGPLFSVIATGHVGKEVYFREGKTGPHVYFLKSGKQITSY